MIEFLLRSFWWAIPGVAKLWYTLTMKLTKKAGHPVAVHRNYKSIAESLRWGKRYRPDALKGHFDTLIHPTEVQNRIDNNDLIGDCDEHAIYWCTSIMKSGLARDVWFSFYQQKRRDTGKISGHVVCVFETRSGDFYWCDYREPVLIEDPWDWVEESAGSYHAEPIVASMVRVVKIDKDDTPVFGKVVRLRFQP